MEKVSCNCFQKNCIFKVENGLVDYIKKVEEEHEKDDCNSDKCLSEKTIVNYNNRPNIQALGYLKHKDICNIKTVCGL